MSENNQESSITTDDLIFLIGEKETTILAKNRQIRQLNAYISTLNKKLKESSDTQESDDKVVNLEKTIEELNNKISKLNNENSTMIEQLRYFEDYKKKAKKYHEVVEENSRLSRLIKEKDEQLRKLKESYSLDGESFK